MKKHSGFLISFEGGEGGGKSTQIALLEENLRRHGYSVISLREPGGTQIGEQIRDVVLSSKNQEIAFTSEVLLFQAARAQLYAEKVLPALKEGKVVLIDRTRDSSVVYQGIVRGFSIHLIEQLNNISTQKTYPNITLLLDVPVKLGLKRRAREGNSNRLDNESTEFHEEVRRGYLSLAQSDETGRWQVIDASQTIKQVCDVIWQIVHAELPEN